MSKQSPRASTKASSSRSISGEIGGPSTGRGMNYQIDYGVFKTLDLISRALSAPHKPWAVRIEPRATSQTALTRWDIGFEPPEKFVEAKLNPKRQDVMDWLDHVRQAGECWTEREFRFIYSEGGGPLLSSLIHLVRMAKEARDDKTFQELQSAEQVRDSEEILKRLGESAHNLLSRIKIKNIPENVLEANVSLRARLLAGEKGGRRLIQILFTKLEKAVPHRQTILIRDLNDEISAENIHLQPPPDVDPADLSRYMSAALLIFQACRTGLPIEVVAAVIGCDPLACERELGPLVGSALLVEDGLWSVGVLPSRITREDALDIFSKALEALLAFIERNKHDQIALDQIQNVLALASKCFLNPKSLTPVFPVLDKVLKRIGDKRRVLEVAILSVDAARRMPAPRHPTVLEDEARSLVCGVSWVYQRVGRLEKARVAAEESHRLGQMVNMDVNLAYCIKCLGRLCRMEAEASRDALERESKLSESIDLLEDAIKRFSTLTQYGQEIGDCYSLLGRTYLVAGNLTMAELSIRKAYELIQDETSKDFLDLVVLSGDWEVARANSSGAESFFSQAVSLPQSNDPEISEMRARAYWKRALNRMSMGREKEAVEDFEKASETWDLLGEFEAAAEAKWQMIRLVETLPLDTLQLLEREPTIVRVNAIERHNQILATTKGKHVARRARVNRNYWRQRIGEAREYVAAKIVEW